MRINAILINAADDVVVTTAKTAPGDTLVYIENGKEMTVEATTDTPIYHKVALHDIKKGDEVHKYGQVIGLALRDIKKGEHVHTQNLNSRDLIYRTEA